MGLKPSPIQVSKAYEQVAARLEAQILEGRLSPGEQLPGEVELASLFGVNRSTVREGIRRLETEGLVRRASPRKLVVSTPRARELASRNTRALRMLDVTFDQLWTVAVEIEPLVAEQAARNASDEDIARLEANQARMIRATETRDDKAVVRLDLEYHSIMAEATRNPALALAQEPIGILLYSGLEALLPHLPQAPGRQLEAHGRVIAAVRAGQADVARDWTLRHAVDFRRGYRLAGLPMDQPIAPLVPRGDAPQPGSTLGPDPETPPSASEPAPTPDLKPTPSPRDA